jgi:putative PIN family toxin of toxin-antitoxin system
MRNKKKVVIDTNVFIDGWYTDDKYCNSIINMIKNRKLQLLFSQDTIGELVYVTKGFARHYYKIKSDNFNELTVNDLEEIMVLFYYGTMVNTEHTVSPKIKDEQDVIFLKCAIAGEADYLVSDDFNSGMHGINDFGFKVLGAKDFVELMEVESCVGVV